jgi:glycosyltransferase involved in cell wall biosynthesis
LRPCWAPGRTMAHRICHLISGDLWAGAEVMAFHLLVGLSKRPEVELLVVLLNNGTLAKELGKAGVATCVLDERKHSFPAIARLAAKSVKPWAPQVLHAHRYKENLLAFLVSLTLKDKAALVSTQHGMPELYGRQAGWLRRLKLRVNNCLLESAFQRTIAVSRDIKESLVQDHSFREMQVETILNGIAIPEARGSEGGKRPFVIGSAGRFVPVKDYPLMIAVAREVCARNPDVRFEFAGDGPLLDDMRRLIGDQGLGNRIVLRGFVSDVRAFYGKLDLFLNTSLHEGIPMSVLEAMAFSVPPVAPRVGGLAEIIEDGRDGYLVDTRDPRDFAGKCLSLCDNAAGRSAMARAAREKVIRKFSLERMVNDYVGMYQKVVEEVGAERSIVTPSEIDQR